MRFQVERARGIYAKALAMLPPQDRRAQRPGLMMAGIYHALLDEIARNGYQVLDRRVSLTPLRKAWIAWKTSWSY
jgi:phytoene synthase